MELWFWMVFRIIFIISQVQIELIFTLLFIRGFEKIRIPGKREV